MLHNIVTDDPISYTYQNMQVLDLYEHPGTDPQIFDFTVTYEDGMGGIKVAVCNQTELRRKAPLELVRNRWYLFYDEPGDMVIARLYRMHKGLYQTLNASGKEGAYYRHIGAVPGDLVEGDMEVEY